MQRNRPDNKSIRQNPDAENNRAPMPMPKEDRSMGRFSPSKGKSKPIPSTMGYVGKRIK